MEQEGIKCNSLLKNFIYSFSLLGVYLFGIFILAHARGVSLYAAPAFWVEIVNNPLWMKSLSFITIIAGTLLIYFIPGIFIARYFGRRDEAAIEIYAKGFLVNYSFYYLTSTFYKLFFQQEFSRNAMIVLTAVFSLITLLIPLVIKKGERVSISLPSEDRRFAVSYLLISLVVFFVCWKSILIAHFGGDGDGVEQFWAAYSVKSMILPTTFREPFTLVPQFSFAPSVYLNMFALTLFGNAEFIIKIQILAAFLCLGFILKSLIEEISGDKKLNLLEFAPLFLYLVMFFMLICFRAAYQPPTDLAKSNEVLQLALFLFGFYLLIKRNSEGYILPAVFFILAAMVRHNGLVMITLFLILFAVLFKRYRCLVAYFAGIFFLLILLSIILYSSSFGFLDMIRFLFDDLKGLRQTTESFSLTFVLSYLWNYMVFTAGLGLFFILGLKNRYVKIMFLTTLAYLILPVKSIRVPVHFFTPIIIFPLLAYYSSKLRSNKIITGTVIMLELVTLWYVYPKKEVKRPYSFLSTASSICVNSNDLFEARKRCRAVTEVLGLYVDERVIMYYADLSPGQDKEYFAYLGAASPMPEDAYAHLVAKDGLELYLNKDLTIEYRTSRRTILEEYYSGNEPYIIYRKDQHSRNSKE